MTLTEFLLARIAEDEREAEVCLDQYRRGDGGSRRRWDRVLAECAAKRRIVETAQRAEVSLEGRRAPATDAINGHVIAYRDVVRQLASVYADHPDYDQAWRP